MVGSHLCLQAQSTVGSLLLAPDGSSDGVEAVADETKAVGELGGHWEEPVGHVGPQHILP